MKDRNLILCILFVLLTTVSCSSFAVCKISKGQWKGLESLIMENDLIKVVVIPSSNGRIAEYIFKPTGTNQFPELVSEEMEIIPGYKIGSTNYAGYEDWFWELGIEKGIRPYIANVIDKGPECCTISLVNTGLFTIERVVSIYEGSTEVDVVTNLTYTGNDEKEYSYWAHIMVEPGDAEIIDDVIQFVPISSCGKQEARKKELVFTGKTEVIKRNFIDIGSSNSYYYQPLQGWWASINQTNKIALIQLVNIDTFGEEGLFYCWSKDDIQTKEYSMSMEVIYPSFQFASGGKNIYELSMITCADINNILYADKNIILSEVVKVNDKPNKGVSLDIGISSPRQLGDIKATFSLMTDKGEIIGSATQRIPKLDPRESVTIRFNFEEIKTPAGSYHINAIFKDANNRVLSSFDLVDKVEIGED